MTDSIKQLLLKVLTVLGTLLGLLGLAKWAGLVDYVLQNFDGVWAAVAGLIAFVVGLIAHFKGEALALKRGFKLHE
jgi:hypothetical protein